MALGWDATSFQCMGRDQILLLHEMSVCSARPCAIGVQVREGAKKETMTALIIASRANRPGMLKLLLEAVANPATRVKGSTALENARRFKRPECIRLLTKALQVGECFS